MLKELNVPTIAQLVERWTVVAQVVKQAADIHRSLVQIRLEGDIFGIALAVRARFVVKCRQRCGGRVMPLPSYL